MPTLLLLNGFKFFFYANDHPPTHVHVLRGERWAKIELSTFVVKYSTLRNQESGIRNQESGIRNQESGIEGVPEDR